MASSGSCMGRSRGQGSRVREGRRGSPRPAGPGTPPEKSPWQYCTTRRGFGKLPLMKLHDLIRDLRETAATKIVLVVADGLGGLPLEAGGKTELETARTPHLDACAREGVCGLSIPVLPGVTPGSGPGHLGQFGYDPLEYRIGRGILEALGINFAVGDRDVAVRGNFVTQENGLIK